MGYIDKHLMTDEKIVYQTKLNLTEYLKSGIILLIGLFLLFLSKFFGIFIILMGLISLGLTYLKINFCEFAVTDKRVLIKEGILRTESLETMLNKVEGIYVEQGIIGKMANSGSIVIKGTGGTNNLFRNIDKPYEFRNAVNEQIARLK